MVLVSEFYNTAHEAPQSGPLPTSLPIRTPHGSGTLTAALPRKALVLSQNDLVHFQGFKHNLCASDSQFVTT